MTELLDCGHPESEHLSCTRGYGIDSNGRRFCYACCHQQDLARMKITGQASAYLNGDGLTVTNWPGWTLMKVHREWHTSAGGFLSGVKITRVWAKDEEGNWWSGSGPGRGMYLRLKRLKHEPR